jgi:aspartyl-tRNA synthetase
MSRILIKQAIEQQGNVTVAGWARNVRAHKGVSFVDLRDISGKIQIVFESGTKAFNAVENLSLESVIEVTGIIKPKPARKGSTEQEYEILAETVEILSLADSELPIPVLTKAENEADTENRFAWRWLDLRQAEHQQIFKVWTALEKGFREYWDKADYLQIYTPTFMSTASESGAEVFAVKYFDKTAYLAQSPQFYKQMAMASGLEKVFAVGTVYRAEKSYTNRHNTEFTGWDFEISYIKSDEDVAKELENMIIMGITKVKNTLNINIEVPSLPFPRLTMKQAKERLAKAGIKSDADDDFNAEEEVAIGKIMKKETNHDFLFVTHYPFSARPFYHMKQEDDSSLTKSFDLLYKGIEITTGAQREHRYDILKKQAEEKNMEIKSLEDYFNFFKFGCPPHGGAGIGPSRMIMKILDLPNIREAVFLPRDVRRLRP